MADTLYEVVGFDYPQAIRELNRYMSYEDMCDQLGYESRASIYKIMHGAIPDHRHGEALWALYVDTIGKKPKLNVDQSAGNNQMVST